ncbi:hypothetical protein [Nocardia sp. NPDC047654]|uniref:hypothetical protein n=1 Tax=Nocardia sp. NPDC047654 TaxID=3364314 RepID=UPI00371987F7
MTVGVVKRIRFILASGAPEVSAHASHDDRSGRGGGWSPGHRASTRQQAGVDDDLAPLGVPAVVVGAVLLRLGLVASGSLSGWVHEYGLLLIAVYTGYMAPR